MPYFCLKMALKKALEIYEEFEIRKIYSEDISLNYSNILKQINDTSGAINLLNNLLLKNENNFKALRLRANIYKKLLDFEKAEQDLIRAINLDKFNILLNKDLVELYVDTKKYKKAIDHCNLMISKNIEVEFFFLKKIISNINIANWINIKKDLALLNKQSKIENLKIDPLSLKYFNDDPLIQKKLTENYWNDKNKNKYLSNIQINEKKNENNSKIRIGYFSADFNNHAVFQLIQDLFVYHNKSNFEIYAYSLFKKEGISRDKIISNVNKFTDVDNFSD